MLSSNLIVSGANCSRQYPVFISDMIFFSSLYTYFVIEGLSVFSLCFLRYCIYDIEYDPSCNSNSSFHVRADILNLLFLYGLFTFFHI